MEDLHTLLVLCSLSLDVLSFLEWPLSVPEIWGSAPFESFIEAPLLLEYLEKN